MAYLPVRSPIVQPRDCENLVSASVKKSLHSQVSQDAIVCTRARVSTLPTYNIIVLDSIHLRPSAHDERIVVGQGSNEVDAFGLDLAQILNVAWKVAGGTTGREGSCFQNIY